MWIPGIKDAKRKPYEINYVTDLLWKGELNYCNIQVCLYQTVAKLML